jgi:hypothetical protein
VNSTDHCYCCWRNTVEENKTKTRRYENSVHRISITYMSTMTVASQPSKAKKGSPQSNTNFLLANSAGDASQVTLLLSDWKNFGLSERVCYHLDLIETLATSSEEEEDGDDDEESPKDGELITQHIGCVSGVASLMECVPSKALKDLTRHQKKALKNRIRDFNQRAELARKRLTSPYHQPLQLPLRLSPATRVSFCYEMTRMAFVLDASPTLVSAFGASDSDAHFCAMDRIPDMVKTFFTALTNSATTQGSVWKPRVAVTVLAVYPHGGNRDDNNTSVLVRDYRIDSKEDAQVLAEKVHEWALSEIEAGIARRLNAGGAGLVGYDFWAIPKYTSSLQDLLDAADVALDFMPNMARPCIVLATDCRSVCCDEILELLAYEERLDVPIHVLDLSSPTSHLPAETAMDEFSNLARDPGGPSAFPLHMPDDSESLFAIARVTAGCFIDAQLLELAATTSVGQVPSGSPLALDQFLVFRRRALRPNALQWYLLFSLSPLTPSTMPASIKAQPQTLLHPAGRMAPPEYLQRRMGFPTMHRVDSKEDMMDTRSSSVTSFTTKAASHRSVDRTAELRRPSHRTTFSTYVCSPVRIRGLLVARVKEGYRAKQYGTSTHDFDKVSIQLTLPIENGTVLHYELQYKALSATNPMVGVAHVKVELSGNRNFVQNIKNEFLSYTIGRTATTRLCKALWWMRREDLLQSFLCPVEWGDKLLSDVSPFVRRLSSLNRLQMMRNFRVDRFDVVCTGRLPFAHDEDLPWSAFEDDDNGEQDLFEILSSWSSQTIKERNKYVKKVPNSDGLTAYCIVEVAQSKLASRLFTLAVYTIGENSIRYRLGVVADLKHALSNLRDVSVLPKRMYTSLVGVSTPFASSQLAWRKHFLDAHFDREEWALVNDPELLDLLMRRRSEIGDFYLLHSTETYAHFAKDISVGSGKKTQNPLEDVYLVEYQIQMKGGGKKPMVNMYVEKEVGHFSTDAARGITEHLTRAHRLFVRVKRRDQECSVALRSRTNLLSLFSADVQPQSSEEQLKNVERLLGYASHHSRDLRFFQKCDAANSELEKLTVHLMLSDHLSNDIVKLDISTSLSVGNQVAGFWFFIKFDRHTLSFVHLPLTEKVKDEGTGGEFAFRQLSFFTFGISDLYCVKEENVANDDDESTHGHSTQYLAAEEFADGVEAAHKQNYAQAAYMALRHPGWPPEQEFAEADFNCVLDVCEFTKATEVFVSQESLSVEGNVEQTKLRKTISGLCTPVPGNDSLMFYSSVEPGHSTLLYKENVETLNYEDDASFDDELSSDESDITDPNEGPSLKSRESEVVISTLPEAMPPLFVRFSFAGKDIRHHELLSIAKGANLTVNMSVFKQQKGERQRYRALPSSHSTASIEIESALKSYIAEQTLERLRTVGMLIQDIDLGAVRKCLRKARDVLVSFDYVHFYVAKTEKMAAASAQAGRETEIEEGFNLLMKELESSAEFHLMPTANDSFCVVEVAVEDQTLKYWSFITIKKSMGAVALEVYHPDGLKRAAAVLSSLQDFVLQICHRTNQLLLLENLHLTRHASPYLIETTGNETEQGQFKEGHFSCPVVFGESYELYHRCSASKVIASLVSTALHSFAVSNRDGVFVYKDEAMGIFYLSLEEVTFEDDRPEFVKLLVFGVQEPGPSLTVSLVRLLRKKILFLAVDAWSSVLQKNPHYGWKKADLEFLRNFQSQWAEVGDDKPGDDFGKREYWFELPEVYDPVTILIYFRQNLCGSTFFHRLNESTTEEDDQFLEEADTSKSDEGGEIYCDPSEFVFFYNNAASPLNPTFQALSTLTARGKKYSQSTGNGIAIIEVSLVKKGHDTATFSSSTFNVGIPPGSMESKLSIPSDVLCAKEVNFPDNVGVSQEDEPLPIDQKYLVKFCLTDTALNREALKDWLHLTLNQVIVGWTIERLIQSSRTGLLLHRPQDERSESSEDPQAQRLRVIDELSPGLPALIDMFRSSNDMPHPAVQAAEFNTVMKASSVASHTADLLRDCIMKNLASGKGAQSMKLMEQTLVVRSSRGHRPQVARLIAKTERRGSTESFQFGESAIKAIGDSPIDCPEYLCFFCWELYSNVAEEEFSLPLPMVFPEVNIGDAISDRRSSAFSQRLTALKRRLPSAFRRSFAFVLSVKRNRRSLTMYNWDPKLVKSVLSGMKELEASRVSDIGMNLRSNQRRCLGDLAPLVKRLRKQKQGSSVQKPPDALVVSASPVKVALVEKPNSGPTRRIRRPTTIRRPKLVGKSVEGGAMQAMAASREKARAPPKGPSKTPTKKAAPTANKAVAATSLAKVEISNEDDAEASLFRRKFGQAMGSPWNSFFAVRKNTFEVLQEYWFRAARLSIRQSTRDGVLLQTKPLWKDCAEISSLARLLSSDLPTEFTEHVEAAMRSIGACRIVPTSASSASDTVKTVFFMVAVKTLPMTSFLVFRLTARRLRGPAKKEIVNCDAWMMSLLRVDRENSRKKRRSTKSTEKRAASLGAKIGIADNLITNLQAQTFDFSAAMVEKAILNIENDNIDDDYLHLTEQLISRLSVDDQQELPRLQYRAFDAAIVLSSYEDKFIDKFDSLALFKHLYSGTGDYIKCGPDTLLFSETIKMYDTTTYCFLKRNRASKTSMGLIYLCRTDGRNVDEHVFPDGSNVAATIFKLIVVEGARLAQDALRSSAIEMYRDLLWISASAKHSHQPMSKFEELLVMLSGRSVFEGNEVASMLGDEMLAIDPEDLFTKMARDPVFSPSRKITMEELAYQQVFFNINLDSFLMFKVEQGVVVDIVILRRGEVSNEDAKKCVDILTQYMLYYLWKS